MNHNQSCDYSLDNKKDLPIFAVAMTIVAALLFIKCKYGFGNNDESFYLTIPYRLCQGDKLFLHEWHLSLLSGYLLVPFMKLYLFITDGSTDGIILSFRYIYVFVQILSATVIFICTRKYSKSGAIIGSLCWAIYAPYTICALSYNSMGIIFLSTGLILFTCTNKKICWFIAGILYANSVLCCPYLAVLYIIFIIVTIFSLKKNHDLLTRFGFCSLGIALAALLFLIYVFSKITFQQLLEVFPYIINDPEHSSLDSSLLNKIYSYVCGFLIPTPTMYFIWPGYLCIIIAALLSKKESVKIGCLLASICLTILHLAVYIRCYHHLNLLLLPINYTALFCYLVFKNDRIANLFYYVWIPGMIYTFCIHLSSNQAMYAISSASAVSLIASIIIVLATSRDFLNNSLPKYLKTAVMLSLFLLLSTQVLSELAFRLIPTFWDTSIFHQTELLTEGPEAGLFVSEEKKQLYDSYIPDLTELHTSEDTEVLFFSYRAWLYLCKNSRNAAYSAWLSGLNEDSIAKLKAYYDINPEKWPDYIFVDQEPLPCVDIFVRNWGYTICDYLNNGVLLQRGGSLN